MFRAVAAMAANGVCKITCKTVENWLRYQRKTLRRRCHNAGSVLCINNFWSTQSNSAKFTFYKITFEVFSQTLHNLQGSRRNTIQWCLQNYVVIRAVAAMAANGVCKITCKTVENWLRYQQKTLRRRCHNVGSVLCINNFWSTQSNSAKFTFYKITFEVFSQTLHNLQGSRRNTIQWCLQNYVVNGWELMSELTSKWINFKILKQIYH